MRTITLELLRHGPAHNQLLSPLTPYLALCENHAAVTLHVPFEHNQFLHRLSALRYRVIEESRVFQLNDTAKVLGDFLGEIPGLTAESNKEDHKQTEPLTHLRLIISSSELALLPFEMALSPNGLPGAGQHLLLQPQMPLCLTREVRRVSDEKLQWPHKPKILFIAAAPPGVGAIPLESHLLALRKVISPWVKYFDEGDAGTRRQRIAEHLHVLPDASIEAIEEACASGAYTHIHILAHGLEKRENYDTRFYLALHNALDPNEKDLISGTRLATALRPSQRPDSRGLARPVVVTLASCDSGNVGSVAGAGASIAHALHESGIPMVVAGQFPLSFEGSVRLLECLYEGLLWGADPRPLLYDLRRRLFAQFPHTHDWASLTAYVSLPTDFDQQLPEVQIERAMHSINAAMNHADEVTSRIFDKMIGRSMSDSSRKGKDEALTSARPKIVEAKKRLERLLNCFPEKKSRIYGLLASTEKRHAEVLFSATRIPSSDMHRQIRDMEDSYALLRKSRDYYWQTFLLERSKSWAVVQYLSLTLMMKHSDFFPDEVRVSSPEEKGNEQPERDQDALWTLAHVLTLYDLHSGERERTIWARGNLIELYLLSLMMPPHDDRPKAKEAQHHALELADQLIDIAGRDSFAIYSTRRQIFRYINWYVKISKVAPQMVKLATSIFHKFPKEIEEEWR